MTETSVFQLSQPGSFIDPLTEVLRDGARALLAQAVEAEVATLLSRYADQSTDDGLRRSAAARTPEVPTSIPRARSRIHYGRLVATPIRYPSASPALRRESSTAVPECDGIEAIEALFAQ